MKKRIRLCSLAMAVLMCMALLAGCGPAGSSSVDPSVPVIDKTQNEFVFTASPTFPDGRTYDITITGMPDETLTMEVTQMPYSTVNGTWVMVDGKGYKLYFEDGTFAYTYFDTDKEQFTMDYRLDLGTVAGTTKVSFMSYRDGGFKSQYDGEGLGLLPPTFTGNGYFGDFGNGPQFHVDGSAITCAEDGTCTFTQTEWPTLYQPRTGTWEYDETTDQYTITFEPEAINGEPGSFKNNYCEATYDDVTDTENKLPDKSMWHGDMSGAEPHSPTVYTTQRAEDGTYWLVAEMFCVEYVDRFMTYNPAE